MTEEKKAAECSEVVEDELSHDEKLQIIYDLGRRGLVFPSWLTRADAARLTHMFYQKAQERGVLRKNNPILSNEEWKGTLAAIEREVYQSIYEIDDGKYYKVLKEKLIELVQSVEIDEAKIRQVLTAFEYELYYPCACALVAMIEGIMGRSENSPDTRLYHLLNNYCVDSSHPESELIKKNLSGFISSLAKNANFAKDSEPDFINRHWLLHGRSEKEIEKVDCLALLNAYKELHVLYIGKE